MASAAGITGTLQKRYKDAEGKAEKPVCVRMNKTGFFLFGLRLFRFYCYSPHITKHEKPRKKGGRRKK